MWIFIKQIGKVVLERVTHFIKGVYEHAETIVVLTCSAIGLNVLLSELPFYIATPMFVEAAMVLPVVSVLAIGGLVMLAETRHPIPAKAR